LALYDRLEDKISEQRDSMADQMTRAATDSANLFEMIRTTRSMRRLKVDPVPDDLIRKILEAGTCAPSGGNMQR
jgi:hypothetical protein